MEKDKRVLLKELMDARVRIDELEEELGIAKEDKQIADRTMAEQMRTINRLRDNLNQTVDQIVHEKLVKKLEDTEMLLIFANQDKNRLVEELEQQRLVYREIRTEMDKERAEHAKERTEFAEVVKNLEEQLEEEREVYQLAMKDVRTQTRERTQKKQEHAAEIQRQLLDRVDELEQQLEAMKQMSCKVPSRDHSILGMYIDEESEGELEMAVPPAPPEPPEQSGWVQQLGPLPQAQPKIIPKEAFEENLKTMPHDAMKDIGQKPRDMNHWDIPVIKSYRSELIQQRRLTKEPKQPKKQMSVIFNNLYVADEVSEVMNTKIEQIPKVGAFASQQQPSVSKSKAFSESSLRDIISKQPGQSLRYHRGPPGRMTPGKQMLFPKRGSIWPTTKSTTQTNL